MEKNQVNQLANFYCTDPDFKILKIIMLMLYGNILIGMISLLKKLKLIVIIVIIIN